MCSALYRTYCYDVKSVILRNGRREKRRSVAFDFEIQFVCEKFRSVKNNRY
jgi:hypothetical protein